MSTLLADGYIKWMQIVPAMTSVLSAVEVMHCVSEKRFSRNGETYHMCFIDNLLLFPKVKEFLKSVNS